MENNNKKNMKNITKEKMRELFSKMGCYNNEPTLFMTKNGDVGGQFVKSESIVKMKITEAQSNITFEMLNESLEHFLTNNKVKYAFYQDKDYGFMIFDKINRNLVQLGIEKDEKTYFIILYPHGKCKPSTLEDLCMNISKNGGFSFSEIKTMFLNY